LLRRLSGGRGPLPDAPVQELDDEDYYNPVDVS
jgi:hypothetical protein